MSGQGRRERILKWLEQNKEGGIDADRLLAFLDELDQGPSVRQSVNLAAPKLPVVTSSLPDPREDDTVTLSRPPRSEGVPPTLTHHSRNMGGLAERLQSAPAPLLLPDRYEDLGPIGSGGGGEVRRVLDKHLNRPMAMKLILPHMLGDEVMSNRFIEEAQITAQLQHPGVVPVHDVGHLGDGRYYFTMKEVTGRTLKAVIKEVHSAIEGGRWQTTESGWTFRRLIDVFRRVCETVAYSHARGVVHRDLKPSNIMVGDYGETLVLDWGLALAFGDPAGSTADAGGEGGLTTLRVQTNALMTLAGEAPGTPAYMAPEQARGESALLGPWTDVYALGAILFQILAGQAPYRGKTPDDVVAQVLDEHRPRVSDCLGVAAATLIPPELEALCDRAMTPVIEGRPANASYMAGEIGAWLEGARRRERAVAMVQAVEPLKEEIAKLRQEARALRNEAESYLAGLKGWESIERKRKGWLKEDRADDLEHEVALKEVAYVQGLRGALANEPNLPEAHERLASYYRELHQEGEKERNRRNVTQAEELLKAHDRAHRYQAYLKGDGALTLISDPPGARVLLYQETPIDRRLEPVFVKELGQTPITEAVIPKGSYILKLEAPGYRPMTYPVFIERGQHWSGVRPNETEPTPVPLIKEGLIGDNEIYVPGGWFWSGGDKTAFLSLPRRRIWLDGFLISRFPISNREYLLFLNDLVSQGREEEALKWVPRERAGSVEEIGPMIYGRGEDGSFRLRPDADGDMWLPQHPVLMISWYCARAYGRWLSQKTGRVWRLPWELEWEKAARGVDGRPFPWGDTMDPTWACVRASHRGHPKPVVVDSFPLDLSPYGVRGMGGNVQDWCADAFERTGPLVHASGLFEPDPREAMGEAVSRTYRGGAWFGPARGSRVAHRTGDPAGMRTAYLGFRLVSSLNYDL